VSSIVAAIADANAGRHHEYVQRILRMCRTATPPAMMISIDSQLYLLP